MLGDAKGTVIAILAIILLVCMITSFWMSDVEKKHLRKKLDEANKRIEKFQTGTLSDCEYREDSEAEKARALYDASEKSLKLNLMGMKAMREMAQIAEQQSYMDCPSEDDWNNNS